MSVSVKQKPEPKSLAWGHSEYDVVDTGTPARWWNLRWWTTGYEFKVARGKVRIQGEGAIEVGSVWCLFHWEAVRITRLSDGMVLFDDETGRLESGTLGERFRRLLGSDGPEAWQ